MKKRIYNKMKIGQWLTLCLLLGLMSGTLYGQNRSVRFQHLTIENGLSQNMVDCILQDSQGFMWFGTWNGLCRYDGYTFETFNNQNVLLNNFIYSLYEDPFGNIWIGTRKGLFTYLYDKGQFVQANAQAQIHAIVGREDSTAYVGSDSGLMLIKFLDDQGKFEVLKRYNFGTTAHEISGSIVNSILFCRNNDVWIGTDEGITIIPSKGGAFKKMFNNTDNEGDLSSNQILAMREGGNGKIWIGTEYGLNRYDPLTNEFDRYFHVASDAFSLPHNSVMDIVEDNHGNLLVATLGGLCVIDENGKGVANYKNEYYADHSLNNDFVNCLLEDDNGNIWIGTERGGVNFYNTDQNIFEHFEFNVNKKNSLSHSTINSIYEDQKYLWIGTAGGGLNRYDKARDKYQHFKFDPGDNRSISSNFITCVHRDRQGQLWSGSWGTGLNRLVNEGSADEHFLRYGFPEIPGTKTSFISSITEDDKGNLWIGTLGGLIFYDASKKIFEERFTSGQDRITEVGCLLFDEEERLWIGTRLGLYEIDGLQSNTEKPKVKKYTYDPDNPNSLSGNYVISLLQDADGNLWFGTYGHGVNKYDKEKGTFQLFSTPQGLSNNIVYSIEQDNKGDIWFCTDYGLSRLDPKTNRFRNFYTSDGLLNDQYYWSASFKNEDDKLYFGGMNGMDAFFPEWVNEGAQESDVVITDIKLLNESVIPNKSYNDVKVITTSASKVDKINLSYKEKIFGVEFSSLIYREPEMIRYAYILEGFENEWNYVTSDRRYASYTNLRPGDYTFKVKASNANGEFNTAPKTLAIHIAPPFWQTNWFRALAVLGLVGLVFGYIRLRVYSLKRQKMLLEKQVKDRTERINLQKEELSQQAVQLKNSNAELEEKQKLIKGQNQKLENQNKEIVSQRDKLMALNKKLKLISQLRLSFFTNVSHEFKTPLTLIIGPLQSLIKDNKINDEVRSTLNIVNRNAQRLLHLINQIMDFRKIEKGKMELKVAGSDISVFCRNIFEAFETLAELKEIDFSYSEKDLPEETWLDAEKFENILYNLLSNAFKYTPSGGKVSLSVQGLTTEQARLKSTVSPSLINKDIVSIKISDSGIGISEENLPLVFKRFYRVESEKSLEIGGSGIGLSLTEELIKTHHGHIYVESNLGQGSTFEVQFPSSKCAYQADEVTEQNATGLDIKEQIAFLKDELLGSHEQTETTAQDLYSYEKDRPTVLVVEDNIDLRKFIAHWLNETYNIIEAGDGKEGIKMAKKNDPDIIISDVMMPHKDGLELCAYLKQHLDTSHIPIILLTAKSSVENQIQGLEIGADEYLPKPFNFELLAARIQNLIDSRNKLKLQFIQSLDSDAEKATTNTKDHKFLEQAVKTVNDSLSDSHFDVSEFVKKMGVSRSLLHKKLTSLTNQSATEFINHLRMKKAYQLLIQHEFNVSEVAYAVGYNDPKYFTRLFSKYFGQSPKSFLKETITIGD